MGIEKRFLRRQGVEEVSGLSRSEIYKRMSQGTFPQPVILAHQIVRWVADEVQQWVADRIAERDARPRNAALPPHPVRDYWASRRAAETPEKAAVSGKPARKPPRKPAHPPPVTETRHRANGHDDVVAARAAPVKAAAPLPKRRGRPATLSPKKKPSARAPAAKLTGKLGEPGAKHCAKRRTSRAGTPSRQIAPRPAPR